MKRKLVLTGIITLATAAAIGSAYAAKPEKDSAAPAQTTVLTGKQFVKDATVSVEQARATALKAFPGKIVDEELEQGKGGSGLRYSFDIVAGHTRQEVWVDAKTGNLLRSAK